MIETQQFAAFVRDFIRRENEELEHDTLWNLWLHKCYDGRSFDQFRDELLSAAAGAEMTGQQAREALEASAEMLGGFVPPEAKEHENLQEGR